MTQSNKPPTQTTLLPPSSKQPSLDGGGAVGGQHLAAGGASADRKAKRTKLARVFYALVSVYIVAIGISAVEELNRREKLLTAITAREAEVNALLSTVGKPTTEKSDPGQVSLTLERSRLAALRAQLTSLILVGSIRAIQLPDSEKATKQATEPRREGVSAAPTPDGGVPDPPKATVEEPTKPKPESRAAPAAPIRITLKVIACDFAKLQQDSGFECDNSRKSEAWDVVAGFFLKRIAEERSSGDVFAVLVVVAGVGGGLIRLFLPRRTNAPGDYQHSALRGMSGGVVCYLAVSGGATTFLTAGNLTAATSPAAGSLLGLLAGMFSNKVFEFLSNVVDGWFDRALKSTNANAETMPKSGAGGSTATKVSARGEHDVGSTEAAPTTAPSLLPGSDAPESKPATVAATPEPQSGAKV